MARKARKIKPAVLTLPYRMAWDKQAGYIDLSQSCSLANRIALRQGLRWAVAGFTIITGPQVTGRILCEKVPDTWVTANAWVKGFKVWQKMNREAMKETGGIAPKYMDFKVYADHAHAVAGVGENLLPQESVLLGSGTNTDPVEGEWDMSVVVMPDTTDGATGGVDNREIIFIGASYQGAGASTLGNVSLVEGYAASRGLPYITDPNVPDDLRSVSGTNPQNWQSAIFNEGIQQDSEVLADLSFDNDQAPYPYENDGVNTDTMYPGGANQFPNLQIHDIVDITDTTVGGTSKMPGGLFNCGLIKFYKENEYTEISPEDAKYYVTDILVHLVPGNHRGYLAEPMQDVN